MGGGVFLLLLFFHWIFLEKKRFSISLEKSFAKRGTLLFSLSLIILALIAGLTLKINTKIIFGAIIGSIIFFITSVFKNHAEKKGKDLIRRNMSDISKLLYLEVLDASFSIDGVLGAFAFTLSVPLIVLGNGLGAFIVRQFTVGNIKNIKKYIYLKNGAMYSIFFLGIIMVLDTFGFKTPFWLSPLVTFLVVGYFYYKSKKHIQMHELKRAFGKK
jgi:hypothetical protein